jgi:benzoyl-CoA reductase/2-hydroxyglutaryl-CoA dehydratase subunit BcrC/BadD/HgdB
MLKTKMDNIELLSEYASFLREKKEEGKKIVAFISHDNIPEELLDAAGFIPLRLIFAGNDDLMDASHDYLPPSTCAFAQSCIGLYSLKPSQYNFLDLIDYFIVSNHCVSDICASEIISKYFNIPRLDFYLSYTKNENSLKYFKLELTNLIKQLEEIQGSMIEKEVLLESIKKYNKFKKILKNINELSIKGSIKLQLLHKAILFGPEIIPELEEEYDNLCQNPNGSIKNLKEILLTGCSIFLNDYLIDLIEEGGGNITFFDSWIGFNYYSQIIDVDTINVSKDPIDLLTERFKNNIYGDHSVPNFLENRTNLIKNYFKDYQAKTGKKLGVINHIIKFCDHMLIMSTHLKNRLQREGIQVLNLERDYSRANRGQLTTRIEAFLEMM